MSQRPTIRILGTRGIPAKHGGFETFAEDLALYLTRTGWDVAVYCQTEGEGPIVEGTWRDIRLITIPVAQGGASGTVVFDWKSVRHAARRRGLVLTLGYNTAVFGTVYRLKKITHLMNMDGLEWKRAKYNFLERVWLYLNERLGCWLADHLIVDHPDIGAHLRRCVSKKKITVIPYGTREPVHFDGVRFRELDLEPGRYSVLIARPEPENSILPIVRAYSRRHRGVKLAVLGEFSPQTKAYHNKVMNAASSEVIFLGALYERGLVDSIRRNGRLYLHGHTVGGTNPSLLEAMAAGMPVLAHDNAFNRWVAGPAARYFADEDGCADLLDELMEDGDQLAQMGAECRVRQQQMFELEMRLVQYESLLRHWHVTAGTETVERLDVLPRPAESTSLPVSAHNAKAGGVRLRS